ncbi:MAG: hypothetical protein Q9208_004411 [Pyrenodesmia sp. 3 TL-2023]
MLFRKFALSWLIVLGAAASPPKSQTVFRQVNEGACSDVHIVGVRGTIELPGFGEMQKLVTKLNQTLSSMDSYAIDYPASGISIGEDGDADYSLPEYVASEAQGYGAPKAHLETYSVLCPDTKIVLMGYSQASSPRYTTCLKSQKLMAPLDKTSKSKIRAVIQLGDPTNRKDIEWHVGSSTGRGVFPRADLRDCRDLADHWRSYCDATDLFCDVPGRSVETHQGYVDKYIDNIVDFIIKKIQAAPDSNWEL